MVANQTKNDTAENSSTLDLEPVFLICCELVCTINKRLFITSNGWMDSDGLHLFE
jgi:hypothetical protein